VGSGSRPRRWGLEAGAAAAGARGWGHGSGGRVQEPWQGLGATAAGVGLRSGAAAGLGVRAAAMGAQGWSHGNW
jgi:hypothetical protein